MFATTTGPTATILRHPAPQGPSPEPGTVTRIRVPRRLVRTHRGRRATTLPRIRRADAYVVRVCRPEGGDALRIVRTPGTPAHRRRVAR
jgi:hypothetical protein